MSRRARAAGLLGAALFVAGCREAVGPERGPSGAQGVAPSLALAGPGTAGFTLDQWNGTLNASGTILIKGFNPTNPHRGDAIVATFFWVGSTNIIRSVTDHLTDGNFTPVGNTYTLVDYVTAGGVSMATYVATNVQNFPDAGTNPAEILAVRANLSQSVTDGGMVISAYSGPTAALSAHASRSGSGSDPTNAAPGSIPVRAGALAYGVSMSSALVGVEQPAGFTRIVGQSDASMNTDADYAVQGAAGSVAPQWSWFFDAQHPGSWLATVLALDPAATHVAFTVQPSTTLPFATITPPVQVTVLDDLGNAVPGFRGTVTIAIGHNGGALVPGTLSGTKTVNVVNGVATFSDLSIDQLGNGYTLRATASGLTGAESTPFNIGAF
jgi:hypothetical protein